MLCAYAAVISELCLGPAGRPYLGRAAVPCGVTLAFVLAFGGMPTFAGARKCRRYG
jgi:hypothetical protein